MRGGAIFLGLVLIMLNFTFANPQSIDQNELTITADREQYFCEPVLNAEGQCLIRGYFNITNSRKSTVNIDTDNTYTTQVKNQVVKSRFGSQTIPTKDKTARDIYRTPKQQVKSGETVRYDFEFWVDTDGKFNVSANIYQIGNGNILATTILDPIYNASFNASAPSWHLENGSVLTVNNIYSYETQTNITEGISDNLDATKYNIMIGDMICGGQPLLYYQFNDDEANSVFDGSGNGNHLALAGGIEIVPDILDIASVRLDNVTGYGGQVLYTSDHNIGANSFTMGFTFYMNASPANSGYLFSRSTSTDDGFFCGITSASRLYCRFESDSEGQKNIQSGVLSTGTIYNVILQRDISSGVLSMYINGGLVTTVGTFYGAVTNYANTVLNGYMSLDNEQVTDIYFDEWVLVENLCTPAEINHYNTYDHYYNHSTGDAIQVFFNREANLTNGNDYGLKIICPQCGNQHKIRIYNMTNMTDSTLTDYVEAEITSEETAVNINSILSEGYNNPFRLVHTCSYNINISDVFLYEIGNDTQPPAISDCFVNDSVIDCNDGVEWGCTVTDNVAVESAVGVVDFGGYFQIVKQARRSAENGSIWHVVLSSTELTTLLESAGWDFLVSEVNSSLVYVNATDLSGLTTQYIANGTPWNLYNCSYCVENWVSVNNTCQTNDTYLVGYIDTNSCGTYIDLPADNGTWVGCNYCSADLEKSYYTNCLLVNGTGQRNYTWVDNNYFSCCAITSLPTDCVLDTYPYNQSLLTENCSYLNTEFILELDTETAFGFGIGGLTSDKVHGKIWVNNTNLTYYCLSYIKTMNGTLVQTNPPYTQRVTGGLLQLTAKEIEDREFFVTSNGLANVYWTDSGLVIDGRQYVFGVECSANNQLLKSEVLAKTAYQNLNEPITRWFWVKDNALGFVLIFFMLLLGGLVLYGIYKAVVR